MQFIFYYVQTKVIIQAYPMILTKDYGNMKPVSTRIVIHLNGDPTKLVWHTIVQSAEEANVLERQIKGWSRKKKEALINQDMTELKRLSNVKKEHP